MTTISIIGSGNMAQAIGTRGAKHGHTIELMSRDNTKAQALADQIGDRATVGTFGEVPVGEIVIVAVLYTGAVEVVAHYGDALAGKILVDITNPFNADVTGLVTTAGDSVSRQIAAAAPSGTHVVKALNSILCDVLAQDKPVDVFFAGDSTEAKTQVAAFLESLDMRPLDAGGLEMASVLEWTGILLVGLARNGPDSTSPWEPKRSDPVPVGVHGRRSERAVLCTAGYGCPSSPQHRWGHILGTQECRGVTVKPARARLRALTESGPAVATAVIAPAWDASISRWRRRVAWAPRPRAAGTVAAPPSSAVSPWMDMAAAATGRSPDQATKRRTPGAACSARRKSSRAGGAAYPPRSTRRNTPRSSAVTASVTSWAAVEVGRPSTSAQAAVATGRGAERSHPICTSASPTADWPEPSMTEGGGAAAAPNIASTSGSARTAPL